MPLTKIFDPSNDRSVVGRFIGFQRFEFEEGNETYLPLLVKETGELVALPSHWLIMETLIANIDRLAEGETKISVTFRDGFKLENGRQVYDYLVEIDDKPAHYAKIITKEQLMAKLLGEGK